MPNSREDLGLPRLHHEAIAADVIEESRAGQELIASMRVERDEALAKLGRA